MPKIYLEVKKVLIDQSMKLVGEGENLVNDKVLMMLDVEKRGQVVDFFLKAGWIQCKPTFVDG